MRVLLAPMEGVLDSLVRELLTEVNDYDLCITEFVRVVDQLLPAKVFHRICPELHNNSRTPSGTQVRIQLLGQHPQWLAENAARAVELGSYGVDLNCGCPSKLVNGSGGGATLLKDPELIYQGAKAMREAVPGHLPVTVKVRLAGTAATGSLKSPMPFSRRVPANWRFMAAPKSKGIKRSISTGRLSVRSASVLRFRLSPTVKSGTGRARKIVWRSPDVMR